MLIIITTDSNKNTNLVKTLEVGSRFVISRSGVQIPAPAPEEGKNEEIHCTTHFSSTVSHFGPGRIDQVAVLSGRVKEGEGGKQEDFPQFSCGLVNFL